MRKALAGWLQYLGYKMMKMENFQILLSFSVVIIPAFLLVRRKKSTTAKILWVTIPTIVMTPIVYIVSIFMLFNIATSVTGKKFDLKKWNREKSNRYVYALDIDTSVLITNKTAAEVIEILGEPDNKSDTLFIYSLSHGSWRSQYGLNPWMTIEFKDDTVSEHYTTWD